MRAVPGARPCSFLTGRLRCASSLQAGAAALGEDPLDGGLSLPILADSPTGRAARGLSPEPSWAAGSLLAESSRPSLAPEWSTASAPVGRQGAAGAASSKAAMREWAGLERWWAARGLGGTAGQLGGKGGGSLYL